MSKYAPLDIYHPVAVAWRNMWSRCTNPTNNRTQNYKERGIIVCQEWENFPRFYQDMFPTWQTGLSLERKDNDQGYSKENCEWATATKQARNRTSTKLTEDQVTEIRTRYRRGLSISLGQQFGVSSRMIRYIANGNSWQ